VYSFLNASLPGINDQCVLSLLFEGDKKKEDISLVI